MSILNFFSWLMVSQVGARVAFHMIKTQLRKEILEENEEIWMFVSILANILMAGASLGIRGILKKTNLDNNKPRIIFECASFFVFAGFSIVQLLVDGQTQLGILQVLLDVIIFSYVLPESTVLHHLLCICICLTLLVLEWMRKKKVEDVAMVALIQIGILIVTIKARHLLSFVCTCSHQIKKEKKSEQDRGEKEGQDERSSFCKICCKPFLFGIGYEETLFATMEQNDHLTLFLNNQTQFGYCIVDPTNHKVLYSNKSMVNKSSTIDLESLFRSISELEFRFDQVGNVGTGGVSQQENDSCRLRGQSSNSTFAFSQKNTKISQPSYEQSSNISKFQGISSLPVSFKNCQNLSSNTKAILQEEQEDNYTRGNSVADQIQKKNASPKQTSLALSPVIIGEKDKDTFTAGIVTARTGVLVSPTGILDHKIDQPIQIEQERFVHDSVLSRSGGEDEQDCGQEIDPSYSRILSASATKCNQTKQQQTKEQQGIIKYGSNSIRSQKISSYYNSHSSKQDHPFRHRVRTEVKGGQSSSEASRLSFFQRITASSKPSSIQATQDFPSGLIGIDFLSSPVLKPLVKYSFNLVENFGEFNSIEIIKTNNGILYLFFEGEASRKDNFEQEMLEELATFQTKIINSISHEFGTPLNCALNLLKICQNQLPAEVQSNLISPALASIRILKFSCSDFIDYSKIQTSQFSLDIIETDIRFVLSKASEYFCPLVEQQNQEKGSITFDIIAENNIPDIIQSDPKRILQVIFNLLTNSLKNTQKGFINIQVTKENEEELRISISDSGIGIPYDKQQNLLSRTTIRNKRQETGGLGLTISNAIASKLSVHGTGLIVQSQIGLGSSFSFLVSVNQKYPADHNNLNSKNIVSQHSLLFSPQPSRQRGSNIEQQQQLLSSPYLLQPKDSGSNFSRKTIPGFSDYCKQGNCVNRDHIESLSQVPPISSIFHPNQAGGTILRHKDSSSISIQTTLSEFEEFSPHQNKKSVAGVVHQFSSKLFPEAGIQQLDKRITRINDQVVIEPITLFNQQEDIYYRKSPLLFSDSSQFGNNSSLGLKKNSKIISESYSATNSVFTSPVPTIVEEEKCDEYASEMPLNNQIYTMMSMNEEYLQNPQRHFKPNQLDQLKKNLRTSDSQSPQNIGSSERLTPEVVDNINCIKSEKVPTFIAELERDKRNWNSFSHRTDSLLGSPTKSVSLKHNSAQFIRDTCENEDRKLSSSKGFRPNRFEQQNSIERSDFSNNTKSQEGELRCLHQSNLSSTIFTSQIDNRDVNNERGAQTERNDHLKNISFLRAKCFSIQDQLLCQSDRICEMQKEERILRNSKRRRTKSEFGARDGVPALKEALKQKPCTCADILIVDDTQMNRHTLKLIITSKFNFVIEEAANGLEAVEKVEEMLNTSNHCRTYKMIFMDIDMPVLNGYDATRQINCLLKQQGLFCPIIAHTAFDRSLCESEMNECGLTDFAGKPIRPQVIESLFTRYIDIQTILGEDV